MATFTVKLAKRGALVKLNSESCKIIIHKASDKDVFVTKAGLFEHEGKQSVYIPNEKIIIPVEDITKIEMPVSRFTPDKMCWMEVDWND